MLFPVGVVAELTNVAESVAWNRALVCQPTCHVLVLRRKTAFDVFSARLARRMQMSFFGEGSHRPALLSPFWLQHLSRKGEVLFFLAAAQHQAASWLGQRISSAQAKAPVNDLCVPPAFALRRCKTPCSMLLMPEFVRNT